MKIDTLTSFENEDESAKYQTMITSNLNEVYLAVGVTVSDTSGLTGKYLSTGTFDATSAQTMALVGVAAVLSAFAF